MSNILDAVIQGVQQSKAAFCRFITGNDTGTTGSHQAGFYIPKCASTLLFDKPGLKGENKEKTVKIKWQNDFITESCMKYYGKGTRNEYRITRFGRDFPFLGDDNVGDLLVIVKYTEEDYSVYVLSSDEDIDGFFAYFNLAPNETNQLINTECGVEKKERLELLLQQFISRFNKFPETRLMSAGARQCYNEAFNIKDSTLTGEPDHILLNWIETEYALFKLMEERFYSSVISHPFPNVESFVKTANEILNRRKSRAGKSLEHHLADLFTRNGLVFEEQAVTEDNNKPDFIFPNGECYHNMSFPVEDLVVLGSKTTCKDRWRQVLTEADRVENKYLFTLQQGISKNQLKEMYDAKLTLVVPHKYITSFPASWQHKIKDLAGFIQIVRTKQEHMPKYYIIN